MPKLHAIALEQHEKHRGEHDRALDLRTGIVAVEKCCYSGQDTAQRDDGRVVIATGRRLSAPRAAA